MKTMSEMLGKNRVLPVTACNIRPSQSSHPYLAHLSSTNCLRSLAGIEAILPLELFDKVDVFLLRVSGAGTCIDFFLPRLVLGFPLFARTISVKADGRQARHKHGNHEIGNRVG
jgi:hypothetical protein